MKNFNKSKESSYIQYLDANKLVINSFKWEKNVCKFNEDFIKNYD